MKVVSICPNAGEHRRDSPCKFRKISQNLKKKKERAKKKRRKPARNLAGLSLIRLAFLKRCLGPLKPPRSQELHIQPPNSKAFPHLNTLHLPSLAGRQHPGCMHSTAPQAHRNTLLSLPVLSANTDASKRPSGL